MIEYRWADGADYEHIIEFANHAFAPKEWTGDFRQDTGKNSFFPRLLPKLYQNIQTAPLHRLALDDGIIVGMVGSFPMKMHVGNSILKVMGIGTVSTHPEARGKGYMKTLMAESMEHAKESGADLLTLDGRRQRYGYWGFEKAGINTVFEINESNVRHTYGKDASFGYFFRKLRDTDHGYLQKERLLRTAALSYVEQEEALEYAILFSMGASPYVILKKDERGEDEFKGTFMYYPEEGRIADVRLLFDEEIGEVANDLLTSGMFGRETGSGELEIRIDHIAPYDKTMLRILGELAESISVTSLQMIRIMNYERVIGAFMKEAAAFRSLSDGDCAFSFDNGETVRIVVQGGVPYVTAGDPQKAIRLNEKQAVELLFHPSSYTIDFIKGLGPAERSWFPLCYFLYMSDEV